MTISIKVLLVIPAGAPEAPAEIIPKAAFVTFPEVHPSTLPEVPLRTPVLLRKLFRKFPDTS